MANSLLTPTAVTRKALKIFHQKCTFLRNVNKQYDDQFAKSGAKIGSDLKIRMPNQYVVRDGATLSTQDTSESSQTLTISTQKGVDLNFTSVDLTLSLDDFADRILEPAMARLAAEVELTVLGNLRKDVHQQVNNMGSAASFAKVLQGRKTMVDALTPMSGLTAILNTQDNLDLVDALKGLMQSSGQIADQYEEGAMGRAAGFKFYEHTMLTKQSRGAGAGYLINGASQTGATLTVDTGTGAINKGEIITIAGVYRIHPETKVQVGSTSADLQQLVVTADVSSGATSIPIYPAIVTSGATKTVSGSPADNAAITIAGTASTDYGQSLLFHRDAFTFASADLVMPDGVDWKAREVYDGVSMRIVRQYDINNDKWPVRLDVLFGYKTLRPEWACRLANN